MPDLGALPDDLATMILVNQHRLGDTFGATAAEDVMAEFVHVAARPDVNGVVIPVEAVTGASLRPTPRGTRTHANRQGEQGRQRDHPPRRRHPQRRPARCRHPISARQRGGRRRRRHHPHGPSRRHDAVGNETGYADEFDVNGPYYGALGTSHFLSDDPYGDLDPIEWATRRLYVPELAIGRLVETPDQIIAQLDASRRPPAVSTPAAPTQPATTS